MDLWRDSVSGSKILLQLNKFTLYKVVRSVSVCYVILSTLTIILWCARKKEKSIIKRSNRKIGQGYAIQIKVRRIGKKTQLWYLIWTSRLTSPACVAQPEMCPRRHSSRAHKEIPQLKEIPMRRVGWRAPSWTIVA